MSTKKLQTRAITLVRANARALFPFMTASLILLASLFPPCYWDTDDKHLPQNYAAAINQWKTDTETSRLASKHYRFLFADSSTTIIFSGRAIRLVRSVIWIELFIEYVAILAAMYCLFILIFWRVQRI